MFVPGNNFANLIDFCVIILLFCALESFSKLKKKKISASGTNSTRIKKKSDKKTDTKLSAKKPEKPITTQIFNYLAREVLPTVGAGLVGHHQIELKHKSVLFGNNLLYF